MSTTHIWTESWVGETRAHSVMDHILSAGFSRKLSSVGTLLLCKIYIYVFAWHGLVRSKVWHTYWPDLLKSEKFLFVMESQTFWSEQKLFCDCLGKMIVSFTTVPGSHECLDYHVAHYCAKTSQFFRKNEILQFLSEGAGSVTQSGSGSVTYFVHDPLSYHL